MKRMTAGDLQALELLMQTTPGFEHFDSGADGILPECRSCRFHRPFWKYQSCVFAECPYLPVIMRQYGEECANCPYTLDEREHGICRRCAVFKK